MVRPPTRVRTKSNSTYTNYSLTPHHSATLFHEDFHNTYQEQGVALEKCVLFMHDTYSVLGAVL
jgi:hypothetical protein